ncbi:fungal Zn(2)-Cys(6) binuclear cluster domain family protein [Aspergillus niger]|nr:fungal Zn(2)-Cys(6) binuclear cluster domain family protein [Aspergillus niger]
MEIQIELDERKPFYTNEDRVIGHVILRNDTEVDIATITISLSGQAISRLDSGKLTESHKLFQRNEQIFPPSNCVGWLTSASVTIPPGEHSFPFCIMFPQVSECYKDSTRDAARKRSATLGIYTLPRRSDILWMLPSHGMGSYTEVTNPLSLPSRVAMACTNSIKQTRTISFHPVSAIPKPLQSVSVRKIVTCSTKAAELLRPPLTYEVEVELVNGPFVLLGHPIALGVKVINVNDEKLDISLRDFQSMLIETTDIRAHGIIQRVTRSWIIQTMTNLSQPFVTGGGPTAGFVMSLDEGVWSRHSVPHCLTPTFETCNVTRSFKLEIRLGIEFGRYNSRILEFLFPVCVLSPSYTPSGSK